MEKFEKKLDYEEKKLADSVADEILTVETKEDRTWFLLILLFLICLIFLVASLSFAIFNTYYNGDSTNVIDVGTDVVVNKKKTEEAGTVLFSYNEASNSIYMNNVLPIYDNVGKKLNGDREYFDFLLSSTLENKNGNIVYEISLLPENDNTLSPNDVRVYLTENGEEVSINKSMVNNFSDLPDSTYRDGAKVIYRKTVSTTQINEYRFRMWYSHNAVVKNNDVSKKFGCKVLVDAHYE